MFSNSSSKVRLRDISKEFSWPIASCLIDLISPVACPIIYSICSGLSTPTFMKYLKFVQPVFRRIALSMGMITDLSEPLSPPSAPSFFNTPTTLYLFPKHAISLSRGFSFSSNSLLTSSWPINATGLPYFTS